MLIVVQYKDETYDMIMQYHLAELIRAGKVKGFSSAAGWVGIEDPPTEKPSSNVN